MVPAKRNFHAHCFPNIFNDFWGSEWAEHHRSTVPAVNIIDQEDCYRVEVAAPGMTKKDFKVQINSENEMLIELEHHDELHDEPHGESHDEHSHDEKEPTYLRREFSYSHYRQRLLLPENIDRKAIQAHVKHGVMTILIPKQKHEERNEKMEQIAIE